MADRVDEKALEAAIEAMIQLGVEQLGAPPEEIRARGLQPITMQARTAITAYLAAIPDTQPLHIVFDGPPGPEAGRFVECETEDGRSINVGQWKQDGQYWRLIIDKLPARAALTEPSDV